MNSFRKSDTEREAEQHAYAVGGCRTFVLWFLFVVLPAVVGLACLAQWLVYREIGFWTVASGIVAGGFCYVVIAFQKRSIDRAFTIIVLLAIAIVSSLLAGTSTFFSKAVLAAGVAVFVLLIARRVMAHLSGSQLDPVNYS